jgi:hypothetical protein
MSNIATQFRYVHRQLIGMLRESEGVQFTDDEREVLIHDLHRLRELIDQVQTKLAGDQQ